MPKRVDLIAGQRFHLLSVLTKSNKKGKAKRSYYDCKCDCGKITTVSRGCLVSGKTKSCGCLRREVAQVRFKGISGAASHNALFDRCKLGALRRGLEFTLTPEQHKNIIGNSCHYCGEPAPKWNVYVNIKYRKNMSTSAAQDAWIVANGIDRLDSKLGYILENCVPCCSSCNYAKRTMTAEEYIEHCRRIVMFQDSK